MVIKKSYIINGIISYTKSTNRLDVKKSFGTSIYLDIGELLSVAYYNEKLEKEVLIKTFRRWRKDECEITPGGFFMVTIAVNDESRDYRLEYNDFARIMRELKLEEILN